MNEPKFFVALTSGDTVSSLNGTEHQSFVQKKEVSTARVSALYFYPQSLRRYVLFSRSYPSLKHYEFFANKNELATWSDPLADRSKLQGLGLKNADLHSDNTQEEQELFADCGAFQYWNQSVEEACFVWKGKKLPVNAENVMEFFKQEHLSEERIGVWKKIMLCSPDHIVPISVDNETLTAEEERRLQFNIEEAKVFLELCKPYDHVQPVAVIHGKTKEQRKDQYNKFVDMGYTYIAIGGIVPIASKKELVLDLLTDCSDMDNPVIHPDSILGRAKRDGIKVHMFGLCSPIWCQWWYRLGIDSFDGSKIATEGAVNGWYWIPLDNHDSMDGSQKKREGRSLYETEESIPETLNDLYIKRNVKDMGNMDWKKVTPNNPKKVLEISYTNIDEYIKEIAPPDEKRAYFDWKWDEQRQLLVPKVGLQQKTKRGKNNDLIDTDCECPACTYFLSIRCPSIQCWFYKQANPRVRHVADVRMAGSTEHNMGRAAHNAFVYEWLLQQLRYYMKKAKQEPTNSKWNTWRSIEIREPVIIEEKQHEGKENSNEKHLDAKVVNSIEETKEDSQLSLFQQRS